jgi:CheY-like chemotaxis protein/HPt (histidine-containing phosphotransfer) domain-containing protein
MGGEIGVESAEGEGSTFWFTVNLEQGSGERVAQREQGASSSAGTITPAYRAYPAEEDEGTGATGETDWTSCRILVVEDNPVNQLVITATISQLGCPVDAVDNGREAVKAIARETYDIVLMDCQMPEMDGYEATETIREWEKGSNRSRTPIIALTANAMQGDRDKCLASGMDDYLPKPFQQKQIYAVLKQYIGKLKATAGTASTGGGKEAAQCPEGTESSGKVAIVTSVLDEIRALQGADAPDLLKTLVTLYFSEAPKILKTLDDAVQRKDTQEIRKAAHTLKSSSASVGALNLASLLAEAERRGREDRTEGVEGVLAQINEEYEAVKYALEAELTSDRTGSGEVDR